MANPAITLDDDLRKRARLKAIAQSTSVNALLRDYLEKFAGDDGARRAAVEGFFELARSLKASPQSCARRPDRADSGASGAVAPRGPA
jgi:Arc/MetJ family transcription regulator